MTERFDDAVAMLAELHDIAAAALKDSLSGEFDSDQLVERFLPALAKVQILAGHYGWRLRHP